MSDNPQKLNATMSDITSNLSVLSIDQKDALIRKLFSDYNILKKKLENTEQDRDTLICEVNRLKFELQMSDLKRLRDYDRHDIR